MLKTDCTHFKGDRPCNFHKETGVKCNDCGQYKKVKNKILIIKLDAVGDVLRTTAILPPLKEKYPDAHITWCTRHNSRDLFINNDYVDELIFVEEDAAFRLSVEEYELVINLDTNKLSSSIATRSYSKQKVGFILNKDGFVEPLSESAKIWLLMSAFDDVKKENKLSYQEIMYDILEFNSKVSFPVLNIPVGITERISSVAKSWNLNKNLQTIGLNIGVGTKWPSKAWPLNRWGELIEVLQKKSFNLLLLGGPEEKESISYLSQKYKSVINTGCNNSIMEFAAIVNLCDVVVASDTFALHVGNALNKMMIVLFGPTSNSEIYLYEKGIKIISPKECKCYYKRECTEHESCMSEIKTSDVVRAINSLLS